MAAGGWRLEAGAGGWIPVAFKASPAFLKPLYALAWKPGARELGLTTATARFAKAMSALKAAKVSGDVDLFAEKQKEAVEAKRIKDEAEARFSAGADDLLGMEL